MKEQLMFRQKIRAGYFDQIFQDKIGPEVSEFEIFISTFSALTCIVIVDVLVPEWLKSFITTVGCPDLCQGFERAGSDPEVSIMSLFVYSSGK